MPTWTQSPTKKVTEQNHNCRIVIVFYFHCWLYIYERGKSWLACNPMGYRDAHTGDIIQITMLRTKMVETAKVGGVSSYECTSLVQSTVFMFYWMDSSVVCKTAQLTSFFLGSIQNLNPQKKVKICAVNMKYCTKKYASHYLICRWGQLQKSLGAHKVF